MIKHGEEPRETKIICFTSHLFLFKTRNTNIRMSNNWKQNGDIPKM